jgi:glutathione synthase/RimK-type ligase-like ATP-grasp enzyme
VRFGIGVLAERRYLSQSQPNGMVAALRARGHQVKLIDPAATSYELGDERWLTGLDLIVARGRSWGLLCLLSWAEALAIPTVNRRAAIAAVHNKAEMAVTLASARVPTPITLLGPTPSLACRAAGWQYPLVLKPLFGDNGRGLQLVNSAEQMTSLQWGEPFALAQQFVPGSGADLKLYAIADEVWAVRKPSAFGHDGKRLPHAPFEQSGSTKLLPVSQAWRELARRCGRLFGLELYGVDCIESRGGPLVIEVNEFPNYTGVPEADERLADYIIVRADGQNQGGGGSYANRVLDAATSADASERRHAGSGAAPLGVWSEGGCHLPGGAAGRPVPGEGRARSVHPEGQD